MTTPGLERSYLERIASDIRSNVAKFSDDRETEQAGYKRYQQVPSDGLISLFCAYWNVIRFVFSANRSNPLQAMTSLALRSSG